MLDEIDNILLTILLKGLYKGSNLHVPYNSSKGLSYRNLIAETYEISLAGTLRTYKVSIQNETVLMYIPVRSLKWPKGSL